MRAYLLKQNETKLRPVDIKDGMDIYHLLGDNIFDSVYPDIHYAISFDDMEAYKNTVLYVDDAGALKENCVPNLELVTTLLYGDIVITQVAEDDPDTFVDMDENKAKHFLTKMVRGRRNPYRKIS